jgi:hypothetical protein
MITAKYLWTFFASSCFTYERVFSKAGFGFKLS